MNINVNALKEVFYKQLYYDYKSFLKIHIKKDGTDVFSKTINQYHGFDTDWDLGKLPNNYPDIRICASIEDFFNIIKTDPNALEYVTCLMQYIRKATTKVEGGWLMVEDTINKLVLKHFWNLRCKDGSLTGDGKLPLTIKDNTGKNVTIDISVDDVSSSIKEHDIIELLGKLPPKGLNKIEEDVYKNHTKKFFVKHLHASRNIRNKFGHKEKLLPDNIADAVILARFKLYSYLATVLCLGTNDPQIDTPLIIEDCSDNHQAHFNVYEVENDRILSEVVDYQKGPLGYVYTLKRCHNYRVEVSGVAQELNLQWFSLSPMGTWDGVKLTIYDNDFEKVAHDPSGTMSSVLDMNTRISETLAHIDKTLCEGTKEQKRQMDQVLEKLQNLQQDNYQSSQAKFEALLDVNRKQSEELFEINGQLEKVNTTLEIQAQKVAEMAESIAGSIDKDKKTNQEIAKAIERMAGEYAQMREAVAPLLNSITEKQEQKKEREKKWFLVKRLPIWIALCAAAIGCVMHCIYSQPLNWVTSKALYIGSLILGPVVLAGWLLITYYTTKRKELITKCVIIADWGAIGLATLLWGIAIAVTPHLTDEELIQWFSWTNKEPVCNRFIAYLDDYLDKHPESENARIKLGEYYLDIANDNEKALEVTAPMRNVEKYPKGCVYAAEALYRVDSLLKVKDIIDNYRQFYPENSMLGIDRLNALLLIDGRYVNPDPDKGLMILYSLAETGNYPQANYDLGHWSATDLAEWRPGTEDVAALRYDLPTAVKYLRRVADEMPKAALELGSLYADLGVVDSAKHYINLAITQAKGDLYNKALFKMGLILERQGQPNNTFIKEVQGKDYAPAIEHKALLEKNHRAAIEQMKRAGRYEGPRTIPPIVFEYLKATELRDFTGLADSALKVLQEQRPDCKFNRTFVRAMESIIGTPRMKKNLDSALVLLRQSAEEGCLYAKMMCCYQDAINEAKKGERLVNLAPLNEIATVIPFARVLLSDFLIRAGYYGEAIKAAQYPIAKNIPAAAFILSTIPSTYDIRTDKESFNNVSEVEKELLHSYIIQKIVRLSPHKEYWLMKCFNSDAAKRSLFSEVPDSSQISIVWQKIIKRTSAKSLSDSYFADNKEGARFWVDVLASSKNIGGKLNIAFMAVTDTLLREKLVTSALLDLQHNNYKNSEDLWKMLLWCLGSCTMDYQQALYNESDDKFKKRYDNWAKMMFSGKASMPVILPDAEILTLEKPILLNGQLDELTSVIEELSRSR